MGSRQVFAKGLALTILLFSWPGDRVAVAAALITHPIVPGQAGDALGVDFQGVMTGVIGAPGGGPDDSLALSGDSTLPHDAGSQPSTGAPGTPAVPAGTARSGTQQLGITGQDPASSLVLGGSPGGSASGARLLSTPPPVLGGPAVVGQPTGQAHSSAAGGGPVTVSGERLSAGKDSGRAALVNSANQVLGDPANVTGSVGSTGVSSPAPGALGRAAGGISAGGNASDSSPPGPTSNSPSNTGSAPAQSSSGATSPAGAGTPTSTPSAGNPSPANGGALGTNTSTPSASNPNPANTNSPAPSASNPNPANGAPGTSSGTPSVVGSNPAGNAIVATPPAPSSAAVATSAAGVAGVSGGASPQLASDTGSSNGTNTFNQILNAAVLNQVLGGPASAGTAATPTSPASASTGLAVSGGGLKGDSVAIGGLPSSLATDSGKTILPGPVLPPEPNLPLPAIEAGDQVRQGSGVGTTTTVATGGSVLPAAIPEPSPLYLTVVTVAVCAIRAAVRRVRHAGKGAEAARSA